MVTFCVGTLRFAHPTKSADSFPCLRGKVGMGAAPTLALSRAAREGSELYGWSAAQPGEEMATSNY